MELALLLSYDGFLNMSKKDISTLDFAFHVGNGLFRCQKSFLHFVIWGNNFYIKIPFTIFFLFLVKKKTPARVPPIECAIKQHKQKSETIKSNSSAVEDFNTPPESPSLNSSASLNLNSKIEPTRNINNVFDKSAKDNDEKTTPPVPPPRTRRGLATKSAKNKLKELHIAAESLEIVANELVNIGETLDMSSSSSTTVPHNGKYIAKFSFI